MALINPEELTVRKPAHLDLLQVLLLIVAGAVLTAWLALMLSGADNEADLVQPAIVVFGGSFVALLATFPLAQLGTAMRMAISRGIHGGTAPRDMIRAIMQISDISRRDGLLSLGEVRTDSPVVTKVCHLVCDAAYDQEIKAELEQQRAIETVFHRMISDVFLHTVFYAILIGVLGSIIRLITNHSAGSSNVLYSAGGVYLPLICGCSLALLVIILLGRLKAAHQREMINLEIAYRGAAIMLEDNNVQRLRVRLSQLLPAGMR